MAKNLKQKVLEFVSIAKECPDNMQEKCFEVILTDYLEQIRQKGSRRLDDQNDDTKDEHEIKDKKDKHKPQQEDIVKTDLHVKARQFLKKYSITIEQLNQLFYKEEKNFLPLYDDLKSTKAAESQIRIALLRALLNGMHSGNFEFNGESVREEAQVRKCYDMKNFATIFRSNAELFDGFEKYKKSEPTIRLSSIGKERLAEIIKDLQ